MKNGQRMYLNLASHPVRNRRLLILLTSLLTGLLLILLALGINRVFRYGLRTRTIKQNIVELESRISLAQQEEKEFTRQIDQAARNDQRWLDHVNQLIFRKSFSWIALLQTLEQVLPDACYIVSLAPVFQDDGSLDINFRVAAPDDEAWMTLVEKLFTSGFKNVRQKSEIRGRDGFIIFDMSVTYERDI